MSDQIKQIALRIRDLREIAGISAEKLSEELNISVELYKQYESGTVDIPVSFLYSVAAKYKVDLTDILTGEGPRLRMYSLVRNGKGLNVERRKEYKYQHLAHNFTHKKAEPFLVTVEAGDPNADVSFNSHPGQEFNYVLEGTLKIILDGHEFILNQGDSLYYDSNYPHGMKALNSQPAKFLAIIL